MAYYGVILHTVIGFCIVLVSCSTQDESRSSSQQNKDSFLKPDHDTESKSPNSALPTSNFPKQPQVRNRRNTLASETENYYGDLDNSGLDSAFLYSDQIMRNLLKTHTPQPLSYARSNFFLNLLKPRTTRYNSWDDHSLMHFGKRTPKTSENDMRVISKRSIAGGTAEHSDENEPKNIDKKSGDPWHSMMSFGKKSDNSWDHNTLHFGKKDDPWHTMMSFGKKSDDSWDHTTLHFGKKDEPWHNMMSFGKRFDGWDHNTMHFGKRDEPWHNTMSFGKRDEPWHNTMNFEKKDEPWHNTMSFGKKDDPWHNMMSFGKRSEPWHSMMNFGKKSDNPWDHNTLHFGKRDDPWHNMMSFGKRFVNPWDHNTLHFGKKDEPWHNTMSFGKKFDNSWDHNTLHFGKRDEPWHNMMSFGKKSMNDYDVDEEMVSSKRNDPWHMIGFGKKSNENEFKREDPWHNMMSFGKKNDYSWNNITNDYEKRDEPWHNMMSFGKKRNDDFGDHFVLHFGKRDELDLIPSGSSNDDKLLLHKKDDPWHSTMSFGKKSDSFGFGHNTMHFGKKDEPWHNMMSFGKRSDDPWDHNTLHFGKREEPWHNMMSFGKRSDNSWDDHNILDFEKKNPWHSMMSFGKKSYNSVNDESLHNLRTDSYDSEDTDKIPHKKSASWNDYNALLPFAKKSNESFASKIPNENPVKATDLKHLKKRSIDSWDNHNVMRFGKKSHPWDNYNTMHFGKKSDSWSNHNTMHFGKRVPWDNHNTMHFGKKRDPWDNHNTMHFGKKSDPWDSHNTMHFGKRANTDKSDSISGANIYLDENNDLNKRGSNAIPAGLVEKFSIEKRSIDFKTNNVSPKNLEKTNEENIDKNDVTTVETPETDRKTDSLLFSDSKDKHKSEDKLFTSLTQTRNKEKTEFEEGKGVDTVKNNQIMPMHSKFKRSLKSVDSLDEMHNSIITKSISDASFPMKNFQSSKNDGRYTNLKNKHQETEAHLKHAVKSHINKRSVEINPIQNTKSSFPEKDLNLDYFDDDSKDVSREIALHFGKRSVEDANKLDEAVFSYPWLNEPETQNQNDYWSVMVNEKRSYPWETQNMYYFDKRDPLEYHNTMHFGKREPWDNHNTMHFGKRDPWDYRNTMHFGKRDAWDYHNTLHFGKRDPWNHYNTLHFGKKFDPWDSHYKMHFGKRSDDTAYNVLHFGKRDTESEREDGLFVEDISSLSDEKLKEILERKSFQELIYYLHRAILSKQYTAEQNREILQDLEALRSAISTEMEDSDENFYDNLNDLKQYLLPILMKILMKQSTKENDIKNKPALTKEVILDDSNNEENDDDFDDFPKNSVNSRSMDYVYLISNAPKIPQKGNEVDYLTELKQRNYEKDLKDKRGFPGKDLKRFWAPFQGPKSIVYPHAWFASQIRRSPGPRRRDYSLRGIDMRMAEKKEDPFNSYMHFGRR